MEASVRCAGTWFKAFICSPTGESIDWPVLGSAPDVIRGLLAILLELDSLLSGIDVPVEIDIGLQA
jgi:hypothetical protein